MTTPELQRALFIFRRDLRLEDNTGLIYALKNAKTVIPCFIFTPEQIESNPYKSERALQFMVESLEDLETQLKKKGGKLYLFSGKAHEVVEDCILKLKVDAVVVNRDYTSYSVKRDKLIEEVCHKHKISFLSFDDALLQPPELILKKNGKPYSIFTPFYKQACHFEIDQPQINRSKNYYNRTITFSIDSSIYAKVLPNGPLKSEHKGGRTEALKILKNIGRLSHYATLRDFPAKEGTSQLSPYLKFTLCSPREIYYAICKQLGPCHELLRQLYWRDFFTKIAFFFPHVFKGAFYPKFDRLTWKNDKKNFARWCEGRTGFPIVDAGMREMKETGLMHNRVRMVAASFLIKDLHIDWRWGERYFAQSLLDYDPAVNNGNWQWSASTGCDAQPYFRIFNPWNQQKKFDSECLYIKKWIPELGSLPPKIIHNWQLSKYHTMCPAYPPPMVNHAQQVKETLATYRAI